MNVRTVSSYVLALAMVVIVSSLAAGGSDDIARQADDGRVVQHEPAPSCEESVEVAAAHSCNSEYFIHCSNADGHWCCPKDRTCGPRLGDCFEGGRTPF
jgi:hypothetical protein